jgi:hypothetical protein
MAMINHSCAPNAAAMVLRDGPGAGNKLAGAGRGKESGGSSAREGARSGGGGVGRGKELGSATREGASGGTGSGSSGGEEVPLAMLVRAARDLRKGEEVAIAYTGR